MSDCLECSYCAYTTESKQGLSRHETSCYGNIDEDLKAYLENNYYGKEVQSLAEEINKSVGWINKYAKFRGWFNKDQVNWLKRKFERKFIENNYRKLSRQEIADELGITLRLVKERVKNCNASKETTKERVVREFSEYGDNLKEILQNLHHNESLLKSEIAEKLDVTSPTVFKWMRENNVKTEDGRKLSWEKNFEDRVETVKSNLDPLDFKRWYEENKKEYEEMMKGKNHPQWTDTVVKNCDYCGANVERNPSDFYDHVFCDEGCMGKWNSENFSGKGHPSWNGGYNEYSLERTDTEGSYYKGQKESLKRDDNSCVYCGMDQDEHEEEWSCGLNSHHIIPVGEDGCTNYADNLVTLCREHHVDVHHNDLEVVKKNNEIMVKKQEPVQ